jgi:hypothetical protein
MSLVVPCDRRLSAPGGAAWAEERSTEHGERFLVAWHPAFPCGILRRHDATYVRTRWDNRSWRFFSGATPNVVDVTASVPSLFAQLAPRSHETDIEHRLRLLLRTRIVLQGADIVGQESQPGRTVRRMVGVSARRGGGWRPPAHAEHEFIVDWSDEAIGPDLTGSIAHDVLCFVSWSGCSAWPSPPHPMAIAADTLFELESLRERQRFLALEQNRLYHRMSVIEHDAPPLTSLRAEWRANAERIAAIEADLKKRAA